MSAHSLTIARRITQSQHISISVSYSLKRNDLQLLRFLEDYLFYDSTSDCSTEGQPFTNALPGTMSFYPRPQIPPMLKARKARTSQHKGKRSFVKRSLRMCVEGAWGGSGISG